MEYEYFRLCVTCLVGLMALFEELKDLILMKYSLSIFPFIACCSLRTIGPPYSWDNLRLCFST